MRKRSEIVFSLPGPRGESVEAQRRRYARFVHDPIKFLTDVYEKYGPLSGMVCDGMRMAFAIGPELNRRILSDPDVFHSFGLTVPGPAGSSQWRMGYGMFREDSHANAQRRKMFSPMLSGQAVESHWPEMVRIVEEMLDGWRVGETVEITNQMRDLSLSAACRVLFGLNPEGRWRDVGRPIERWMRMNSSVGGRLATAARPSAGYRRMLAGADQLESHVRDLVGSSAKPGTLLFELLKAPGRENPDRDELLGQTAVLLAAAYETTAMALTWTTFLVAQHPEVASDVLAELNSEVEGDAPTVAEMGRLELLDRVIKESLRLLPPAVYGTRVVITPTELGGHMLAKGTSVFFSHYVTQHLPEIFSEPQRFLPQRWESANPSPFAYMPWGAGPRKCIGATYSKFVMKLALAMIFKRYRLSVATGATINRSVKIILFPRRGIPMVVSRQDGRFGRTTVRGNINEMVDMSGESSAAEEVEVTLPALAGRGLPSTV
ncbi:MAG: cytochrome P450 [Tepidisphaeraceae bacterium]